MKNTEPNNQANVKEEDDFDLFEIISKILIFLKQVRARIKTLWITVGIGFVFGLIFALGTKPEYEAKIKLLPYKSGSAGSGLSGLAGLAGVKLPDGTSGPVISLDLYPSLVETFEFRKKIAETPVYFSSLNAKHTALYYFKNIYKPGFASHVYAYTFGLPEKLLGLLKFPEPTLEKQKGNDTSVAVQIPKYDASYIGSIHGIGGRLVMDFNPKTSIIVLKMVMPDDYAAADLLKYSSKILMETAIAYEVSKAKEQVKFLEVQFVEAEKRFQNAQRKLASFNDRNRSTFSSNAQVDEQWYQNEYNLSFELYSKFAKELEQARITVNQDTPVFTILEDVVVPNKPVSPKKGKIMIFFLMLGAFVGLVIIYIKSYFSVWRQRVSKMISGTQPQMQ